MLQLGLIADDRRPVSSEAMGDDPIAPKKLASFTLPNKSTIKNVRVIAIGQVIVRMSGVVIFRRSRTCGVVDHVRESLQVHY